MNCVGTPVALATMTDASIETTGLENLNRVASHKDGSADWSLSIGAPRGIEKALPGNRIAVCFGIEGSELVDDGCGSVGELRRTA